MRLYICYGTYRVPMRPGGHPCRNAERALRAAGHRPELIRSYGARSLPTFFNRTRGRRKVERLTGSHVVPVLALDDGVVAAGRREIVAWAQANRPRLGAQSDRALAG
jgi:hypothetical protein